MFQAGGYKKRRPLSRLQLGTIAAGEALAGHCYFNQGELACLKKLIPRRRSITKLLRKAIGRQRITTARVTTLRPARSQRRLRVIRRPPASTPTRPTARASRTSKRIQSRVVGEVPRGLAGLFHFRGWMTDDLPARFPDHVDKAVRSVTQLHSEHHGRTTSPQRAVNRIAAPMGRPWFIALLILAIAAWIAGNSLAEKVGVPAIDPPPFAWLEVVATLFSLAVVMLVL